MHEFAFGILGLLPREYYMMTEAEYVSCCKGYSKREKGEWQRARLIAYTIHTHMASNPVDIEEFLPLEEKRSERMTEEEMDEIFNQNTNFLG